MDEPGIAVVGENNWLVPREQGVEVPAVQAVGMLFPGLQRHQVDHVNDSHPEVWRKFPEQAYRCQDFQRRYIAGAGHHHVRFAAAVITGPLPDADAIGAMLDRDSGAVRNRSRCRRQ